MTSVSRHIIDQVPSDHWDVGAMRHPLSRWYHQVRYASVRQMLVNLPKNARLLDVGCGGGFGTSSITRDRVDVVVTGIDISPTHVTYARQIRPTRSWVVGEGEALPFPGSVFEVVTMLDVLEHFVQPERALSEARRVLVPDGLLVVQVTFEKHPLFVPFWKIWLHTRGRMWAHAHQHTFSSTEAIRSIADAGYSIEKVRMLFWRMSAVIVARRLS